MTAAIFFLRIESLLEAPFNNKPRDSWNLGAFFKNGCTTISEHQRFLSHPWTAFFFMKVAVLFISVVRFLKPAG